MIGADVLSTYLNAKVVFSVAPKVFQWCSRKPRTTLTYSLGTICFLIDEALNDLHHSKPRGSNPYEGQCYIASRTLKNYFGRKLTLFRAKDHSDQYHWWVETKEGEVIDLTGKQYEAIGAPVPSISAAATVKEKHYGLGYPSYKKRVAELESLVDQKLQALDNKTVAPKVSQ